jgi:hypothetical protein
MDIDVFSPGQMADVLQVLRTALQAAPAPLSPPERRFLHTYAAICGRAQSAASDPASLGAADADRRGAHPLRPDGQAGGRHVSAA